MKYAGAGAWIDELARKGRHWGLTMFFISQQVSDTTDDPHATSLLTQGSVRCLFRQQDAPSRAGAGGTGWLAAVLGLSEEEVRQVQRLGGSEEEFVEMFLWRDSKQTGPRRGIVNVLAHPLEYWLFTSEPNRDRPRRDAMIRACGGDVWAAVKALAADEDDECSPASHSHNLHPGGFLPPPRAVEVCALVDVMDLDGPPHATEFAAPSQQARDDVVLACVRQRQSVVHKDRVLAHPSLLRA